MIRKSLLALALLALCGSRAHGQKVHADYSGYSPKIAVKTNAIYWATTTPNLGFEIGLGKRTTLDISGNYNPWTFGDNRKLKHWLVQPELRIWTCERFAGHFFGVHAHYAQYNAGGMGFFGMRKYRYQGELYGGGLSYGYQWLIGKRWNMEATLGIGYARLIYDKYDCPRCGEHLGKEKKNYFGPTKVGLSFVYLIK